MSDLSFGLFNVVIGFACGAIIAAAVSQSFWRTETVERGLAIYCPQNGQWAWIGECGDE